MKDEFSVIVIRTKIGSRIHRLLCCNVYPLSIQYAESALAIQRYLSTYLLRYVDESGNQSILKHLAQKSKRPVLCRVKSRKHNTQSTFIVKTPLHCESCFILFVLYCLFVALFRMFILHSMSFSSSSIHLSISLSSCFFIVLKSSYLVNR